LVWQDLHRYRQEIQTYALVLEYDTRSNTLVSPAVVRVAGNDRSLSCWF
jgi:hypothetical protein